MEQLELQQPELEQLALMQQELAHSVPQPELEPQELPLEQQVVLVVRVVLAVQEELQEQQMEAQVDSPQAQQSAPEQQAQLVALRELAELAQEVLAEPVVSLAELQEQQPELALLVFSLPRVQALQVRLLQHRQL